MRVLHLFSGSGSMDQAFKDRGHEVTRIDIEPSYHPDIVQDVGKIDRSLVIPKSYDVILAGFPCEKMSVGSIGKHWVKGYPPYPKTEDARQALILLGKTLLLIRDLQPKIWLIENPVGKMRKLIPRHLKYTVWYCQYGDTRAKPTDIFGSYLPRFYPRSCHNGAADHERAPRGARTGTQGREGSFERSKMPYELSDELRYSCENLIAMDPDWLEGFEHLPTQIDVSWPYRDEFSLLKAY